jgi:hypothetical protein
MQNKLTKIFKKAKYEPDSTLAFSIWQNIVSREKHTDLLKLWSFSLVGVVSLIGLVPSLGYLMSNLTHSGFDEYFSLIFSGGSLMLSYWRELSLSLVESLPMENIIFTLSLFLVCFLSLKYLVREIWKNQPTNSATLSISI